MTHAFIEGTYMYECTNVYMYECTIRESKQPLQWRLTVSTIIDNWKSENIPNNGIVLASINLAEPIKCILVVKGLVDDITLNYTV